MSLSRKSDTECPLKENCPATRQLDRLKEIYQRDGVFSRVDPDTGFYFSEFLLPALEKEISRAQITGTAFSFLLVGLWGEANGSGETGRQKPAHAMDRIARFFHGRLRPIDLPFVLGSDEMGMILCGCSPARALGMAKTWQEDMVALFPPETDGDSPGPRIFIGVNGYFAGTPFSGDELLIQTRRLVHELKKGSGGVGRVTSLHVSSPTEVTEKERSMLYGW